MATFTFELTFKKDEEAPQPTKVIQLTPIEEDNSEPLFKPELYPVQELDSIERYKIDRLKASGRFLKRITSYQVSTVKIVFDGETYSAELSRHTHGEGLAYWKKVYQKEIALAKAICYARHVKNYGNFGQALPAGSTEFFNIKEAEVIRLQNEQRLKEITITLEK
jgi:hypothetical protein